MSEKKRIVILGGLGFLGSHLARTLVERGFRVRVFDKLYASRRLIEDIVDQIEIVEGDFTRPADVKAAVDGCETVFHLVHTTVPGSSMKDPGYDVSSNVVSSARWLSDPGSIRRVIYVSSGGTVYGPPLRLPLDENHPTNPLSSYGVTKLSIEKYVALYSQVRGFDYLIARPSNVYGEGQRLENNQGAIGVFLSRVLKGEPLEVWGDGENSRDYIHVSDMTNALVALLEYAGDKRVFNVSSGVGTSLRDIIDLLEKITGRSLRVEYSSARGFDLRENVLDSSLLQKETGWRPRVTLFEGLKRLVESHLPSKSGFNPAS